MAAHRYMHAWTACENGVYCVQSHVVGLYYSFSFECERGSVPVLKDLDQNRGKWWNAHRGDRIGNSKESKQ